MRCKFSLLVATVSRDSFLKLASYDLDRKVIDTTRYDECGYELRKEEVSAPFKGSNDKIIMESCYSLIDDGYIGSEKDAQFFCEKGIKPQTDGTHPVCSIGFCEKEKKWYGWSHRAMCGFGLGDKIFEERYGDGKTHFKNHGRITIKNMDDAKQSASNFADSVS